MSNSFAATNKNLAAAKTQTYAWQPSATLATLQCRAQILKIIRDFFAAREVMEVETPVLAHTSVTDPFIESMPVFFRKHPQKEAQQYYLQTSPEYAMKRLLAAGSGAIYQITKAFRQGEVGRFHNPEFTMLEWYRPGFNHHQLMDEVDLLLQCLCQTQPAERKTYAALFDSFLQIDVHTASVRELKACALAQQLTIVDDNFDKDTWLNLLLTHCIEPHLGTEKPFFIYDFPASQAALARIQTGPQAVASRFEVYVRGVEIANGFHELQDAHEQRKRFENNLKQRQALGLAPILIDEFLLAALEKGLPDCAGVALGIDRLIMLITGLPTLAQVMSFDFSRV